MEASRKMGQKHGKGQRNSIPDPRAASGNSGSRLSVYPEDHQDPIFLPNLGLDFGGKHFFRDFWNSTLRNF